MVTKKSKKLFFVFVSTFLVLTAVTLLFSFLEKKELIQTTGPEDIASHQPVGLVQKKSGLTGDEWVIRQPGMLDSRVPIKKKPDIYRVACVGGSFMMGFPYTQAGMNSPGYAGIPHWLLMDLSLMYPSKSFEVINLGAAGQNSERVARIVWDVMSIEPDLLIVATGNNEGDLGSSRIGKALHQWIVYRVLKKTIQAAPSPDQRPLFTLQNPDAQKIEKGYRRNISSIIEICKKYNKPLILASLPVNLRYEYSEHKAPKSWQKDSPFDPITKKAVELIQECEYQKAIDSLSGPGTHVYSLYLMGVCYEMLGEFEKAREFYRTFVQSVPMNRTRPSFNEFLRTQAKVGGFYFVDLEKEIEDLSHHRIANEALFIDYCHLKWWANRMMARSIADKITSEKLVTGKLTEPKQSPALAEIIRTYKLDSLMELKESEGATQYLNPWETGKGRFPPANPNLIIPSKCLGSDPESD